VPLNRTCLGKQYPPAVTTVTAEATQKYARACNEENPRYFDPEFPGGIVAPPMFVAVVTWIPVVTAITDPELHADLLRLLHTSQEMEFLAPIRPGDEIIAQARIDTIEASSSGDSLTLALEAKNQRAEIVNRTRFTVVIRGRRSAESKAHQTEDAAIRGEPLARVVETIDRDQTYRYAEASGDVNPIHVNEDVARMAGLPGVIVHGLCTTAFAARAIIDTLCKRDPLQLKRMSVNYSRPVFPGDSITTSIWNTPGNHLVQFETVNMEGAVVIRGGTAAIGP
jgi:acyl dehydratase